MARRASPTDRSSAAKQIPAASSGADGSKILDKRSANSAVTSLAPNSCSAAGKNGNSTADASAVLPTIHTSEAPAKRLACSRSPRPMAREVSAATAIDRPMASESMKNSSVLA